MFVGHPAVALAARAKAPDTSLGILVGAASWLDLVWPILLLTGVERVAIVPRLMAASPFDFVSYPWSHSLTFAVAWAAALGLVAWRCGYRPLSSVLIGGLVASHWVLDFVVHRPDLPLWPGRSPKLGLGLWNFPWITLLVEGALLTLGLTVFVRARRPRNRRGALGFWLLIAFYVASWLGALFGPAPPDVTTLAWVGIASWLLPVWAWWADRNFADRARGTS